MNLIKRYINRTYAPDAYYYSIVDAIDSIQKVERKGWYLYIDLDNTILPKDQKRIPKEIIVALRRATREGRVVKAIIISNLGVPSFCGKAYRKHAIRLADASYQISLPYIEATVPFLKPCLIPIRRGRKKLGAKKGALSLIIGDQVVTDIRVGKKAKMKTILVCPSGPDGRFTKLCLSRVRERFILNCIGLKPI